MSAIGDYVHYNQANYNIWGIANETGNRDVTPSEGWSAAAQSFRASLMESVEVQGLMQEAMNLEKQYNELFYPSAETASSESSIAFRSALETAMQALLEEEFGLMAGKFNANYLAVDTTPLFSEMKAAIDSVKSAIHINNVNKNSSLTQMVNTTNQILKLLDRDEFSNVTEIQTRLQSAKQETQTIKQKLIQLINEATDGKAAYPSELEKKQDIETLNNVIRDFNRVPLIKSNQSGQLFEWMLPLIGINLSNLGKETLVDQMMELARSSNIGNVTTEVEIPDLLGEETADADILTDNVRITTISVRNKTDVKISYTDNDNQLQTRNISAKNTSGRSIKLADDTTLYRALAFSSSSSFATHYLNVVSASSGKGSNNASEILEANRLVKALILKLGAEGYDTNNTAQLLVVNQKNERHIYVYNLKALVYIIQNQMLESGKYTNLVKGLSDSYTIHQNFDKNSADNRIKNVIAETNKVKITARLSGSALNSYLALARGV